MRHRILILGMGSFLIFLTSALVYGQTEAINEAVVVQSQIEPEIQWVWGEVISVDAANNELKVKYLDFEADQEKEMVISVDEGTSYENVSSLSQIKPGDNLSIDYIVAAGDKNIAKTISMEKPEAADINLEDTEEITPEDIAPESPEEDTEQIF